MIGRAIAIAAIAAGALWIAAPAFADTSSTGAGIEADPVCLSTPLQPGHASQLETNGFADIKGVQVHNTGTSSEDLVLAVTRQPGSLPGIEVPPSWVSFGYPKELLVIPQHHVSLSAGASATIPVTVNVPPGAARGTYVAGLAVSTGTGSGGVQLGAGAETLMVFTVGISKPDWSAQQLGATGNCWAPPGAYVSWQQWAGTSYATAPPGWYWPSGDNEGNSPADLAPSSWAYSPPPGWAWDWSSPANPHQVYTGGRPVVQCADPADYPDPFGGDEIGGQYPITSTPAGCAAWLAASKAGTLTEEPAIGGKSGVAGPRPGPLPQRVQVAADRSPGRLNVGDLAALAAILIVPWGAVRLYRRGRAG